MNFLVTIPTYNRPDLLLEAIESVATQDYPQWRMIVSDNKSDHAVADIVASRFNDPRITVLTQPEHVTGTEHARRICQHIVRNNIAFDYFNMMADDDFMAPGALSYLAALRDPAQLISGGIAYYFQKAGEVIIPQAAYAGDRLRLSTRKTALRSADGIGVAVPGEPACETLEVPENHVSFIFMHQELFLKLHAEFGGYLVDPFGDVGLGRVCRFIEFSDYLKRPIGLVRFFNNYGQVAGRDRRKLAAHHKIEFARSPLKHVSFANCAAESYLAVLSDIGYKDARLTPRLFLRHLREVVHDNPKNAETLHAFGQAVRVIVSSGQLGATANFGIRRMFAAGDQPQRALVASNCLTMRDAATALVAHFDASR